MAVVNVGALAKEAINLYETDFTDGTDHNSSISAGTVGEIGVAEVGSDGQLASYDAYRAGQPPQSGMRNTQGNEVFVDLETGTDGTDVDAKTEWRLAWRPRNQNRREPLHRWFKVRNSNNTDPRQQPTLALTNTWVKDGREVVFEAKNESTSVTVHRSNSDIEIPSVAGY